jgi:hypothetical protein
VPTLSTGFFDPWTRQQIRDAFPDDDAPRYLLRDRDGVYGSDFGGTLRRFGIEQVVSAPQSLRQNPFVERVIGTIRRECLDHGSSGTKAHCGVRSTGTWPTITDGGPAWRSRTRRNRGRPPHPMRGPSWRAQVDGLNLSLHGDSSDVSKRVFLRVYGRVHERDIQLETHRRACGQRLVRPSPAPSVRASTFPGASPNRSRRSFARR